MCVHVCVYIDGISLGLFFNNLVITLWRHHSCLATALHDILSFFIRIILHFSSGNSLRIAKDARTLQIEVYMNVSLVVKQVNFKF